MSKGKLFFIHLSLYPGETAPQLHTQLSYHLQTQYRTVPGATSIGKKGFKTATNFEMGPMVDSSVNISIETSSASRNGTQCPMSSDTARTKLTLEMAAYVIITVAGLTGNFLVSLIIYKNKKMRTSANYFILNMSISDILFLLILMPRKILELFVGFRGWLLTGTAGEMSCKFVYYFQDISVAVSIQSIVILAVDRFMAVMFPMRAGTIMSRTRKFVIPSTWIFGMALHSPYFYTFKLNKDSTGQTVCDYSWQPGFDHIKTERIYSIVIFTLLTLLPVSVITTLYTAIVLKLNRRKMPPGEVSASRRGRRQLEERQRQNRNVSKMVVVVVVVFIFFWAPINVFTFLNLSVWEGQLTCEVKMFRFVALLIAFSNSAINPTIYFVFSENYRLGIKKLFFRDLNKEESDRPTRVSRRTFLNNRFNSDFFSREENQDATGSPRMKFRHSSSYC